jgi:hypothetical protein
MKVFTFVAELLNTKGNASTDPDSYLSYFNLSYFITLKN